MLDTVGAPFRLILRHRRLLTAAVLSEIRKRYAGSILGLGWAALAPLLMLAIYATVYVMIYRLQSPSLPQHLYILYIFCGLVPFLGLSEGLSAGTSSISGNKSLLLNTVFPAELITIRTVLAAQTSFIAGMIMLLAATAYYGTPSPLMFLIPVLMLLQIGFLIGISWFLSLLSLALKDIQQIIIILIMLLMVISPIAYTLDMAPPELLFVVWANPFSYFIVTYQTIIVLGELPPAFVLSVTVVMGIVPLIFGFHFFNRTKAIFSDFA